MYFSPLVLRNKMNKALCIMEDSKWFVPNKRQSVEFRWRGRRSLRARFWYSSSFIIYISSFIIYIILPVSLFTSLQIHYSVPWSWFDVWYKMHGQVVTEGQSFTWLASRILLLGDVECNDFVSAKLKDQDYFSKNW